MWLLAGVAAHAYNIKCGPLQLQLGAQVTFLYSDNANQSGTDPKEDWGIDCGPTISSYLALPVRIGNNPEELLTLRVSSGFSYRYWLNGGQQVTFTSPTGLYLSLPMHFGQWVVTVNDSFTFTNEPLESYVAVGTRRATQYDNVGSVTGTRRFGRFALSLSAQRHDRWAPQIPSTEETVYAFSVTPSVYLQESFFIFWSNSLGFVYPKDYTTRSDGINFTTMIGVGGMITPTVSGSVGIGYVHSEFEPVYSGSTTNAASGVDGVTAQIGLNYAHPLRPNTTHAIRVFYSPGVTATLDRSNYQTVYGVMYTLSHRMNRQLTIAPNIGWMHSQNESGGFQSEYDMFQVGVSISRGFTRHLSGALSYRHQERTSPQPGNTYQVNQVYLSFYYSF